MNKYYWMRWKIKERINKRELSAKFRDIRETTMIKTTKLDCPKKAFEMKNCITHICNCDHGYGRKPTFEGVDVAQKLDGKTLGTSAYWKFRKKAEAKQRWKLFHERLERHKNASKIMNKGKPERVWRTKKVLSYKNKFPTRLP